MTIPCVAASYSSKGATSVKGTTMKNIHNCHSLPTNREEEIRRRRTRTLIFDANLLFKILHSTINITT
jgi:hypothetical protein